MSDIANIVSVKPVLIFPVIFFSEILFAETPADSVNPPPAYFSKGRVENGIYLTLYENPALTGLEERHNFQIKNTITGVDVLGSVNWLFFYDKGLGKKKKHNLGIGWEKARYGFIIMGDIK